MDKSITEVVHESVKGLYDVGLVDAKTMKNFDVLCLPEIHKQRSKQKGFKNRVFEKKRK